VVLCLCSESVRSIFSLKVKRCILIDPSLNPAEKPRPDKPLTASARSSSSLSSVLVLVPLFDPTLIPIPKLGMRGAALCRFPNPPTPERNLTLPKCRSMPSLGRASTSASITLSLSSITLVVGLSFGSVLQQSIQSSKNSFGQPGLANFITSAGSRAKVGAFRLKV